MSQKIELLQRHFWFFFLGFIFILCALVFCLGVCEGVDPLELQL